MSRPQSLLDKLDALDAIADRGVAAQSELAPQPTREPRREPPPAAAPSPMSPEAIYGLLMELKRDISHLQREQVQAARPPQEQQLYAMLAELRRDIANLQREPAHVAQSASSDQQLYGMLAELRRDIASLQREAAHPPQPAAAEQQLYGMLADLKRDVEVLRREQAVQALPPAERQLYAMLADLKAEIRTLQEGSHSGAPPAVSSRAPRRASPPMTAAQATPVVGRNRLAMAASIALLALVPLALAAGIYQLGRDHGSSSARVRGTAETAVAQRSSAATPVFAALTVGVTSPKGESASGVSDLKALTRASQLLAAEGARDTDEAEFWLKRYMTGTLNDRQVTRAMTQLGSVYADAAAGKPADFVKARYLWEISSSAGDPVAMCFLGRLFENGLGVGASRTTALQWYQRAKVAGGCAGLDESLARVR